MSRMDRLGARRDTKQPKFFGTSVIPTDYKKMHRFVKRQLGVAWDWNERRIDAINLRNGT